MPTLSTFRSPADQATKDFAGKPALLDQFQAIWNTYVNGFTQQSILGNPWTVSNSSNATNYFNPLVTDVPTDAVVQNIFWNAMPGRISYYNSADWGSLLTQEQIYEIADFGTYDDGGVQKTFPNITKDPCSGAAEDLKYGPYGPRGWQDEYTEWCVTRDENGNILRIDFTCENPEYWYTLWRIDPQTALEIYRTTLDNPNILIEDLYLKDPTTGAVVIDPSTGRPAYNPLNKWNSGPHRTATAGGAMHLTSTPNTLQTETGLAGAATIQRSIGNSDPEDLLCCAQYGQPFRNSDPHIGQVTNQVVGAGLTATLADPPGLYIQMPDFSQYSLPANAPTGAKAEDYWRVVRGALTLDDQFGRPLPGNLILHAVYEVPADQGFTVSDIRIAGQNIRYASQVAATFSVQLNAMAFTAPVPASQPCVGDPATVYPQPLQMFFTSLWNAYYGTDVANPVGFPMNLASSTVIVPPTVSPGQQVQLTLTCTGLALGPGGELPIASFPGGDVGTRVLGLTDGVTYAVPGNSYPSTVQALALEINVLGTAAPGLRAIEIRNAGQPQGPAAPAFLNIQPGSAS
jgi:hypothetical protein